jgi:hypothetical protein
MLLSRLIVLHMMVRSCKHDKKIMIDDLRTNLDDFAFYQRDVKMKVKIMNEYISQSMSSAD